MHSDSLKNNAERVEYKENKRGGEGDYRTFVQWRVTEFFQSVTVSDKSHSFEKQPLKMFFRLLTPIGVPFILVFCEAK